MSPAEKWLFGIYFLLQILIPLRHFLVVFARKGSRDLLSTPRCMFSWTMMPYDSRAVYFMSAYDRRSGKELGVFKFEDFLNRRQCKFLYFGPGEAVQLSKFLATQLHEVLHVPEEAIEVRAFYLVDINERGEEIRINEDVDLTQEHLRILSNYPWWKY